KFVFGRMRFAPGESPEQPGGAGRQERAPPQAPRAKRLDRRGTADRARNCHFLVRIHGLANLLRESSRFRISIISLVAWIGQRACGPRVILREMRKLA